jgi:ASCH domain
MFALSIRQPWASLILKAGKDIENRNWPTKFRGRILIHAAKGCTYAELDGALDFATAACGTYYVADLKTIPRGGIIGSVDLVDCVSASASPWFVGKFGFVLRDPQSLPFTPWKGQLGFFDVPDSQVSGLVMSNI